MGITMLLLAALAASSCGDAEWESRPQADRNLDSSLIRAAESGDLPRVRQLLARGADVHGRDADGRTALTAAAYGNHLDVARVLVGAGADVNAKDDTVQSPYLIATSEVGEDPRLLELTSTVARRSTTRIPTTAPASFARRSAVTLRTCFGSSRPTSIATT